MIENGDHTLARLADIQLLVVQLGHQSLDKNFHAGDKYYSDSILDNSATAWSYTSIQQHPSAAAPLAPRALLNRWLTIPSPVSHANNPSHNTRMEQQPEQAHEIARMDVQDLCTTPRHGISREIGRAHV